ncbi:E3 ubiquitin-protein ligase Kcmf1-like [Malaya genurostris]|uniref:E3 ubiquitin-protein ligase Kcmf1-like n=1 Tax=Malaya genurostris TaxID=325434 RepID=UPI0026F3EBA6|nr:E3 ubiquitin-protein ligase Kcmf1-like [Malaya genurostris]
MSGVSAGECDCQHRFRCLFCSDTEEFCNCFADKHHEHPRQMMISDDLLLAQFGTTTDESEYEEINIFDCPYCDRRKLSISSLNDHLSLEHQSISSSVRCPVCVCFNDSYLLLGNTHLSEHLTTKHSVTLDQYQESLLVYDIYCDDERGLLKFIAATLPPTDYTMKKENIVSSSAIDQESDDRTSLRKTIGRICAICLDLIFETCGRELICKHKFHSECINRWIIKSPTCPVCRISIMR